MTRNLKRERDTSTTIRTDIIHAIDSVVVVNRDSVYVFSDSTRTIERHYATKIIREVKTDSIVKRDTVYTERIVMEETKKTDRGKSIPPWVIIVIALLLLLRILIKEIRN